MTITVILLGEPGSGKSTLTQELISNWTELTLELTPVKHVTYDTPYGKALQLGWSRPPFSGTDTLGQAVITSVAKWYQEGIEGIVVAEGDRLANDRFVRLAKDAGPTLIFYLNTDPRVAQERRITRARAFNLSTQNPSWILGRQTKHRNLAERWDAIILDGNKSTAELVAEMRYYLSRESG